MVGVRLSVQPACDVNVPHTEAELQALRQCAERGTPVGNEAWISPIAARLGLEFTLRPRGRARGQGQVTGGKGELLMFDGPARE
jgi:hypothetical protein